MTGGALQVLGFAGGGTGLPQYATYHGNGAHYLRMSNSNFGSFDEDLFAVSVWVNRLAASVNRTFFLIEDSGGASVSLGINASNKVEFNGYTSSGTSAFSLSTGSSYASTSSWFHIYARRQAGADTEIYVNGVEDTVVTVDSTDSVRTPSGNFVTWNCNGYLYQGAFISGAAPAVSSVYSAGKKSLAGLSGLHSMLDVAGGDVTSDFVRGARWTNTTAVTASTSIPS